jgi:hypothetical protein
MTRSESSHRSRYKKAARKSSRTPLELVPFGTGPNGRIAGDSVNEWPLRAGLLLLDCYEYEPDLFFVLALEHQLFV